jgi:hypothetical protein
LFRKPPQTETKRKDGLLRVDLLVQAYNEMGYDAVNIGEKDLIMGLQYLSEVAQKAKFPFLSANLVNKTDGKPLFKAFVVKEIAGLKIGIFGLLDNQFNQTLRERDFGLAVSDPFTTSKALVKSLREYCDVIVLLSQLGESKDKKLARENPQIDLILGGGGESRRPVIERVNDVPIYRLEPRGGYLGRIDYTFTQTKRPIRFLISSERDEVEKRLERLAARLTQMKSEMAKSGKQDEVKRKELDFLDSRRKELEKALSAYEDKNFYRHTVVPVQVSVPDDPKIVKGLETFQAESAKLYRPKVVAPPEKGLSEREMLARIPKGSPFVGAISCKRCHETNYANWLKTKHARASQTVLDSPKYAQNECLTCHSTGYGKMGEYATVEEVPFYLRGVQCEACHGEGHGHPGKERMEKKVTLGICRNCHTKDQSPAFNYVAYLEQIGCKISK